MESENSNLCIVCIETAKSCDVYGNTLERIDNKSVVVKRANFPCIYLFRTIVSEKHVLYKWRRWIAWDLYASHMSHYLVPFRTISLINSTIYSIRTRILKYPSFFNGSNIELTL